MRCKTRTATPIGVRPPWRSRSSCPLKVSLTDSISCRSGPNSLAPGRSTSPLRAGRIGRPPPPPRPPAPELGTLVVLVRNHQLPGPGAPQVRLDRQDVQQVLPLIGGG